MNHTAMHHQSMPSTLAALGIALGLSACSVLTPQQDPTRYFALRATATGRIASTQVAVGIGPVTLPGYLDHKEIVTAGPDRDLELAEFHVWAEPMEGAVTRVVAKNVSQLLNSPAVVPFPDADIRQDYRTGIVVRRFEMGADHKVRLDASYAIEPAPGSERSSTARFRSITVAVEQPDSHASVVEAMSRALGELSESIARDLVALDRKDRP